MLFRRRTRSNSINGEEARTTVLIGPPSSRLERQDFAPWPRKSFKTGGDGPFWFEGERGDHTPGAISDFAREEDETDRKIIEKKIFSGVDFADLDISDFEVKECIFQNCSFSNCTIRYLGLERCAFVGCRFYISSLIWCAFDHCLLFETNFSGSILKGVDFDRSLNHLVDVAFRPALLSDDETLGEPFAPYTKTLTVKARALRSDIKDGEDSSYQVVVLPCVVKGILDMSGAFLMRVRFSGISHDQGQIWMHWSVNTRTRFESASVYDCRQSQSLREKTEGIFLRPDFYTKEKVSKNPKSAKENLKEVVIRSNLDQVLLRGATFFLSDIAVAAGAVRALRARIAGSDIRLETAFADFEDATLARCSVDLALDAQSRIDLTRCIAGEGAAGGQISQLFSSGAVKDAFNACSATLKGALTACGADDARIQSELAAVDLAWVSATVSELLDGTARSTMRWSGLPEEAEQYLPKGQASLDDLYRSKPINDAIDDHYQLARQSHRVRAVNADLSGVDLGGNNFVFAECIGANFNDAVLEGADFTAAALCNRADYARLRRANLSQVNFTSALLVRADFQDAVLFGARFHSSQGRRREVALVRSANFAGVTGLTGTAFANLDLTDAKLPDRFGEGALSAIETVSIQSRNLLAMAIIASAYVFLTVFNINADASIREIVLPVIEVAVPAGSFTLTAGTLLLFIYAYIHTKLRTVWGELRRLPSRFPDGRPAGRHIYPFVVTALATPVRGQSGRIATNRFKISSVVGSVFEVIGAVMAGWFLVPAILGGLVYFEMQKRIGDVALSDLLNLTTWPPIETSILGLSLGVMVWSGWVLMTDLRSREL